MSKKTNRHWFRKFITNTSLTLSSLLLSALILLGCAYVYLAWHLPNVSQLKDVHLQVPLRIYTSDNKLLGEFGEKKRMPVRLNEVPKTLINAILDTEDQRFYEHPGVDFISLMRAAKAVFHTGHKTQGASTITMQVARNFFLTSDKTYARKLKEIMLALKIDQELTKNEILELYVNKIYLGQRAYGVAAAAQIYYGKPLQQLNVAELALIAGLPQAPSRDNPIVNPHAAFERRNHVLERMYGNKHINYATYKAAIAAPITASYHEQIAEIQAPYVAEMVRAAMEKQFGADVIYDHGYSVYTTIDGRLQNAAQQAVREGVMAYERRHSGYRGIEKKLGNVIPANWLSWQHALQMIPTLNQLSPAAIIGVTPKSINALLADGSLIEITKNGFGWIRHTNAGATITIGDVIRVYKDSVGNWCVGQLPKAEAALIALRPNDGAILSLVGGFSYGRSSFNRVTQAGRQAGSAFKPFIYAAALDKGFTLASIVNDAPVVIADRGTSELWRPQNDNMKFYGPTRLRVGLMKSRNLVSIRLLQAIGIPYAIQYLQRFGFAVEQLPNGLSLALGTANVTPMQLTAGYAIFANGGYRITPYFIQAIKDQDNKVVFRATPQVVPADNSTDNSSSLLKIFWFGKAAGTTFAPRAISSQIAYLITDALKDVIRHGTGAEANNIQRTDLAGKTGTTNNQNDAWFAGYNGDLVTTVWMGYDQPTSLYEHGAQAALPIWIDYMRIALKNTPEHSLVAPIDIVKAQIDPKTGLLTAPDQSGITELFIKGTEPKETAPTTTGDVNVDVITGGNDAGDDADDYAPLTNEPPANTAPMPDSVTSISPLATPVAPSASAIISEPTMIKSAEILNGPSTGIESSASAYSP